MTWGLWTVLVLTVAGLGWAGFAYLDAEGWR